MPQFFLLDSYFSLFLFLIKEFWIIFLCILSSARRFFFQIIIKIKLLRFLSETVVVDGYNLHRQYFSLNHLIFSYFLSISIHFLYLFPGLCRADIELIGWYWRNSYWAWIVLSIERVRNQFEWEHFAAFGWKFRTQWWWGYLFSIFSVPW